MNASQIRDSFYPLTCHIQGKSSIGGPIALYIDEKCCETAHKEAS